MALISDGRFVEDGWRRLADEESLPKSGKVIITQPRLAEALAVCPPELSLGVIVANTMEATTLAPHFEKLGLIAVMFPVFSDGRGFSLGRLLRRAGFRGELRASGRLIADQYTHARGCGFDTIEIPADIAQRQDEAQWAKAGSAYAETYQRGYEGARRSIIEARLKAAE